MKKQGMYDNILVSLYVDDMNYTRSPTDIISDFKNAMMKMFEVTDV